VSELESAIDIALSTEQPQANRVEISVIPLTSTESLVATRGLAKHIDKLYKAVARNANEDRALLQVFNFLSTDVQNFRRRSFDIARLLNPDGPDLDPSRAGAALAMASLIRGELCHKAHNWPKPKDTEQQTNAIVADLLDINGLDFFDLRKRHFDQARHNLIYWQYQLEDLRPNPYMVRLREAIEESDHGVDEV